MKAAFIALAACFATALQAQDIDRYIYFEKYGILDPGVSNRTAHALVREGIHSEDARIVESVVGALGNYASKQKPTFYFMTKSPYGSVPDRGFADIPGLKEFLIGYWRREYRLSGGADPHKAFGDTITEEDIPELRRLIADFISHATAPELPDPRTALDSKFTSFDDRFSFPPKWTDVPGILASLYPGDADVLRFIWEADRAVGGDEAIAGLEVSLSTLMLLNWGKFATPEANALRIGVLTAPIPDSESQLAEEAYAVAAAARGIGLSRPAEAIPALLSIGAKRGHLEHTELTGQGTVRVTVLETILVTLAKYDDVALSPYTADIAPLLDRARAENPLGAMPDAIERLRALVNGQAISPASPPRAGDIDTYRYFRDRGIFDPDIASARANALVREGVRADDARIVDATIRALGWFISHRLHGLPLPYGVLPERDFAQIPGLKDSLMEHWRRQRERHGYDALADFIQASGGIPASVTAETASYEDRDASNSRTPAWLGIPRILCAIYPTDAEVLRFVWELHAGGAAPGDALATLSLLNIGKFATPEADALRFQALAAPEGSDATAAHAARAAARGLAFSRPLDALPHLLSAGMRHDQGDGEVLVTLAGYDDGALLPYADELVELLAKSSAPYPLGAVPEAIERLEAIVGKAAR